MNPDQENVIDEELQEHQEGEPTPAEGLKENTSDQLKETVDDSDGLSEEELADLLDDDDFDETPSEPEPEPAEEQQQEEPPKEEEPPAEENTGEEPPEEQQQEAPQQEPVAQQEPEPEAEPAPTPEDLRTQQEEFFRKGSEVLAEQVYVLDDETKEALDTTPSEVVPKLMGQMHMQIMTAAVTQVANMLPSMLAMQNERQTAADARDEKFYTDFPHLKGHEETVLKMGRAYRQANPNATFETAAPEIAAMAQVALRLPVQQSQPSPAPKAVPPKPTSARAPAPAAPAVQNQTEWDELINEED